MKMAHATFAALMGVVTAFGLSAYGQSGGGASGGGGGASGGVGGAAATGAASGGVAGATGSAGVASGVASPGAGIGAGVGGAAQGSAGFGNFNGGGNTGFGGQSVNRGFGDAPGASGGLRGRNFNSNANAPQQFRNGQQGINSNGRGSNPFSQGDRMSDGRGQDLQSQRQNFSNQVRQGTFDDGGQGSFSQGMTNQGAFGLGNGNRSSFFDNQPFNNQGFGQDAGGGSSANSSMGVTDAGDPSGFTGAGSDVGDPEGAFDNRGFSDNNVDDFSQGTFDQGAAAADADQRFEQADGDDVSSSDATSGFGTTSDAESGTGAGTGPNSSRGFTAASDPPGFNGTASPLSRSSDGEIGAAGRTSFDAGNNSDVDAFRQPSQQSFAEQQRTLDAAGLSSAGSASDSFNSEPTNTGVAQSASSALPPRAAGTVTDQFDVDNRTPAASGSVTNRSPFNPTDDSDGPVRPGQYFNTPAGSQPGLGLYGPRAGSEFNRGAGAGFGQGTASTFQSSGGQPNQQRTGAAAPSTFGGAANDGATQNDEGPVRPGQYFNTPAGNQPGIGLYGPGGYGFMQQYSGGQQSGQGQLGSGARGGTQSGSPQRTRSQTNPNQGQQGSQTPNYFNGSYSRSRL